MARIPHSDLLFTLPPTHKISPVIGIMWGFYNYWKQKPFAFTFCKWMEISTDEFITWCWRRNRSQTFCIWLKSKPVLCWTADSYQGRRLTNSSCYRCGLGLRPSSLCPAGHVYPPPPLKPHHYPPLTSNPHRHLPQLMYYLAVPRFSGCGLDSGSSHLLFIVASPYV